MKNTYQHLLKTRRAHVIPMSDLVYTFLSAQAIRSGFVFKFPDGHPLNVGYISGLFRRFRGKAGLSDEFSFHSLRHTGASWLVKAGATLYEVQQLLGHTSPTTTQIYAHLASSELHEVINKIKISAGSWSGSGQGSLSAS